MYNKYVDTDLRAEVYQRTVIRAVEWEDRKASNVRATGGQMAADQARVFIPMTRGADYLLPPAWQALADKTGKWTLQVGDIVVKGAVTTELGGEDGSTVEELIAANTALTVSSVDTMDMGSAPMRHWQVGAK